MSDVRQLLRDAASQPSSTLDIDAVVRRAARRRWRRAAAATALTAAALVGPIWYAASTRDTTDPIEPNATPPVTIEATVATTAAPPAPSTTDAGIRSTTSSSTSSTTSSTTTMVPPPPPGFRTVSFVVVDQDGEPRTESVGLNVCPATDEASCGSDNIWLVDSDGDGAVSVSLRLDVVYDVQAFAVDTGWPQPWVADDGTEYHFSAHTRGLADEFIDGTPIVLVEPIAVEIRVVDGVGEPLPPGIGGVMACEADESGECTVPLNEWKVADDADGDGTVLLGLVNDALYSATAIARGSGWCNPGMIDDNGLEWHFGEQLIATAGELDGSELRVVDPCASD